MTENYRLTTDADREAFYALYQYAFNNHDTPERRAFLWIVTSTAGSTACTITINL
ncbi:GNAT family protein [Lactiplantibacillus carotarum]|uniref:hypothetical protein n=1 Tax=Lactiplantibacillus carotarum TaxID=2993456 RepID=UPI00298EE5A1|nr:hypothetical protein [Lactiplantibacillus carotarum]